MAVTEVNKSALDIPVPTKGDDRPVVTLHAQECRKCSWRTGWSEAENELAEAADAQTEHARETGHRKFWHYTVQRGQSQLYFLPDTKETH